MQVYNTGQCLTPMSPESKADEVGECAGMSRRTVSDTHVPCSCLKFKEVSLKCEGLLKEGGVVKLWF